MKAGVYEIVVIWGINQFIIITETAPTLPANPAKVPTEGPLNKSLDSVCRFPIANWNPNKTTATI